MNKNQRRNEDSQTRNSKLTVAEIEEIHEMFVETGGYVNQTAQRTGFSKSTVSRYAGRNDWREELPRNNMEQLDQRTEGKAIMNESPPLSKENGEATPGGDEGNEEAEEQVMSKLIALRGLLFEEIMGGERAETLDCPPLKILPRTLAEAVKALIDVDKRIIERKENQPATLLDTYQSILARCAKVVEDEIK